VLRDTLGEANYATPPGSEPDISDFWIWHCHVPRHREGLARLGYVEFRYEWHSLSRRHRATAIGAAYLCSSLNEPPAGGITAWIDDGSHTEKSTFYGTIVGDRQVWPAADRIPAWMHETALRLFPDSPYAKEHSTEGPTKPARD
jgi:hypothetical protein